MAKSLITLALLCASLPAQVNGSASATAVDGSNSGPSSAQLVNPVIEWNRTLLAIVRTPGAQPPTVHSTRNFAILHAAIYDAVNSIEPKFSPYSARLSDVPRSASKIAAADTAAHDVLVSLYPAFQASLDTVLEQGLGLLSDNERKAQGIVLGRAVAINRLAVRSHDVATVTPTPSAT